MLIQQRLYDGPHIWCFGNTPNSSQMSVLHGKIKDVFGGTDPKEPCCVLQPAAKHGESGFGVITSANPLKTEMQPLAADGFFIPYGHRCTVVAQVADCAPAVLYLRGTGTLLLHCSRAALSPRDSAFSNILTDASRELQLHQGRNAPDVQVWIGPHISAPYFVHQLPQDRDLIKPYERLHKKYPRLQILRYNDKGTEVYLDLETVLKFYLCQKLQIPPKNIRWQNPCTFASNDLASYRQRTQAADKALTNTVMVVTPECL